MPSTIYIPKLFSIMLMLREIQGGQSYWYYVITNNVITCLYLCFLSPFHHCSWGEEYNINCILQSRGSGVTFPIILETCCVVWLSKKIKLDIVMYCIISLFCSCSFSLYQNMNCTNCSCVYKVDNLYIVFFYYYHWSRWVVDTVPLGRCYAIYISAFVCEKTMKKKLDLKWAIVTFCFLLYVSSSHFSVIISFSNLYIRKSTWFAWEWLPCLFYFGYFSSIHLTPCKS